MARTITIKLSDEDELNLAHDILDPEQWLRGALAGKIDNCRSRLLLDGTRVLRADASVAAIPTSDDALWKLIVGHAGYRNRRQRDSDSEKLKEGVRNG